MKLLSFTSTLFATVCLATKRRRDSSVSECAVSNNETNGLQGLIMKEYPEVLPPYLVSYKDWGKDLATAFAIGLALGKSYDSRKDTSISNNAEILEKNCVLQMLVVVDNRGKVVVENLRKAIAANSEWKDKDTTYNPFIELFDIHEILSPVNYGNNDNMLPDKVRFVFAKNAKRATAMVAIDVALLKWFALAIKSKSDSSQLIKMSNDVFMPLCALGMIPFIQQHCTSDILTILTQLQQNTDPAHCSPFDMEYFTAPLITLLKFLDVGPIRTKVEEMLSIMCLSIKTNIFLNTRMILGKEHPFVQKIEGNYSNEAQTSLEALLHHQTECQRKIYSTGYAWINGYGSLEEFFPIMDTQTLLSAIILQESTLDWKPKPFMGISICFKNKPGPLHKPVRLFIFSKLPEPAEFWQTIRLCTSLPMFQNVMTKPEIQQMLLTYGITILQDSSE